MRDKTDRLASLSPVDESIDPHVADAGQPPAVTNVRAGALTAGAPHLALRLLPSTGIRARSGARARDAVAVSVAVVGLRLVVVAVAAVGRVAGGGLGVVLVLVVVQEVRARRTRAGAATGGGVRAARLRGAVGLVGHLVVDRGEAADGAIWVFVPSQGLAGLEALAAGVGACMGLDVLEAVGHALEGGVLLGLCGWR